MLSLFKIEWMKIKSYRTFWILFGCFILLFPLIFYFSASQYMAKSMSREEEMIKSLLGSPYIFPNVWHTSSWFGGLFLIILGMLFILLITNEVQYRTHRQNIIDGWSRLDFLKAKATLLIFFVIVATLLVFLCGLWVGSIYTPAGSSEIWSEMYYLGYFALMAVLYLSVAFLVAILIKRTGLSIIIYFTIVYAIDNLLWLFFVWRKSQVASFMPLESADSLVPFPFFRRSPILVRTVSDTSLIIAVLIYIVIFAFIIKNYFQKTDLKT